MSRTLFRSAAFVFLLSVTAHVQTVSRSASIPLQVHGQVRYGQGGRPAELILVRLESFGGGIVGDATTDRNGSFMFTGLTPELYIVSVRLAGFREVQQQVDLRTQLTDYVQLLLVAEDSRPVPSSAKRNVVIDANVPLAALSEFEKGRDSLSQPNNLEKGIGHLESAVRLYPQYLEAMLLLGTAYMDKRDWENAENKLKQVLIISANTTGAHFGLGELYFRQKKYAEAEKEMLSGISLDPKSVQGHFMLGRLYYELGNLAKAAPQVGTALQLDPKLARGYLLAGNILLRAHQTQNAIVEFEEYLRLEPKGEFSERAKETVRKLKRALRQS